MFSANKHEVLKFLLGYGTSLLIPNHVGFTPLHSLADSGALLPLRKRDDGCWYEIREERATIALLPTLRVIAPHLRDLIYETPEETIHGILSYFQGTADDFLFLQENCCPTFYQMPSWVRIAVATRVIFDDWDLPHVPKLVRTILRDTPFISEDLELEWPCPYSSARITFVHTITSKIGWLRAGLEHCQRWGRTYLHREQKINLQLLGERQKLYDSWKEIFCEFLAAGIDVHQVVGQRTPFVAFLEGYLNFWERRQKQILAWDTALQVWLEDLLSAGVDLQHFGQTENRVWKGEGLRRDLQWRNGPCRQLIGFSYGSSPRDWRFWFSETSDHFAGEFWALIEKPIEMMPGAWPDQ